MACEGVESMLIDWQGGFLGNVKDELVLDPLLHSLFVCDNIIAIILALVKFIIILLV